MKIEIECEWDEDSLALVALTVDDKRVPRLFNIRLSSGADKFLEEVARWQIEQNKRNVSP